MKELECEEEIGKTCWEEGVAGGGGGGVGMGSYTGVKNTFVSFSWSRTVSS